MRVVSEEGVWRPVPSAARAAAIIGEISVRRDNPVVPSQRLKADVEALLAALALRRAA